MSHRSLLPSIAFLALGLAACSVPADPRGNSPTPEQMSQIKPGVSDKATVTRIIGSPSSIAAFDSDTWYYISQKTKAVAFFKPELVDQEVVVIDFDKDGMVRDIRRRGMADHVDVTPDPNATPAPGREFTFWEQLVGNFGRFSNSNSPAGGAGGGSGVPGPH